MASTTYNSLDRKCGRYVSYSHGGQISDYGPGVGDCNDYSLKVDPGHGGEKHVDHSPTTGYKLRPFVRHASMHGTLAFLLPFESDACDVVGGGIELSNHIGGVYGHAIINEIRRTDKKQPCGRVIFEFDFVSNGVFLWQWPQSGGVLVRVGSDEAKNAVVSPPPGAAPFIDAIQRCIAESRTQTARSRRVRSKIKQLRAMIDELESEVA